MYYCRADNRQHYVNCPIGNRANDVSSDGSTALPFCKCCNNICKYRIANADTTYVDMDASTSHICPPAYTMTDTESSRSFFSEALATTNSILTATASRINAMEAKMNVVLGKVNSIDFVVSRSISADARLLRSSKEVLSELAVVCSAVDRLFAIVSRFSIRDLSAALSTAEDRCRTLQDDLPPADTVNRVVQNTVADAGRSENFVPQQDCKLTVFGLLNTFREILSTIPSPVDVFKTTRRLGNRHLPRLVVKFNSIRRRSQRLIRFRRKRDIVDSGVRGFSPQIRYGIYARFLLCILLSKFLGVNCHSERVSCHSKRVSCHSKKFRECISDFSLFATARAPVNPHYN